MNNSINHQSIVGAPPVEGMALSGDRARSIVFTPRWDKTANSTTRRYRGERPC